MHSHNSVTGISAMPASRKTVAAFTVGLVFAILTQNAVFAQDPGFNRADSLRGKLTPIRTCYDVTYYHLDIKVDPGAKTVSGSNTVRFRATTDFDRMQIDLTESMAIEKIVFAGQTVAFERELGAVYIELPGAVKQGSVHDLTIYYSGTPQTAKRPPWDGGFVWTEDELGNPWVAVTVQGSGAFLWWPNKEHQSDEPDSMLLSVAVPDSLMNISNGRLRDKTDLGDGWMQWNWFISYPINNYNVTLNIGKFAHFEDSYQSADGDTLTLDYYVLPYNLEQAKTQFQQVKPMMSCMERLFGKYPFYRDGYKLIESPHNGMEHQTAVAYGNGYRNGYRFTSFAEVGLTFDFIILHETAHEWWGNSVTSKDIADMWIHESFGAYAEALYVECVHGYEASLTYQNGRKPGIRNDRPIIGTYEVNNAGSSDMYSKGAVTLGTLRSVIDNDELWFEIIHGIQEKFKYQTITSEDVFSYINERAGEDFNYFFDQYFRNTNIPELQVAINTTGDSISARYKWNADVPDFRMPIKVTTAPATFSFIYPTTSWQEMELDLEAAEDFRVAEDLFYVRVKRGLSYRIEDAN